MHTLHRLENNFGQYQLHAEFGHKPQTESTKLKRKNEIGI